MKRIFLKIAMLVFVASMITIACGKDEVSNTAKTTPTTTQSLWPAGALTTGNDTYYYYHDEQTPLNREESILYICFASSFNLDSLPQGYTVLIHTTVRSIIPEIPDAAGAIILFDRNRATAIEELKGIPEIFAIEPVYRRDDKLVGSSSKFMVLLDSNEDPARLMRFADSIHCTGGILVGSPIDTIYQFQMNHSLINSVAACNLIYEMGIATVVDPVFF